MRTTITLAALALNVILVIGIAYISYFAPRSGVPTAAPVTEKVMKNLPVKSIGLILPSLSKSIEEEHEGVMAALKDDNLRFIPDVKVYNGNGNRSLIRSNVEAALDNGHDLLMVHGSQSSQMVKELSAKRKNLLPVVFMGTGDPLKLGLIDHPDRSGNNLTGVCVIGVEWIDQMVDLIPIIAPFVKRVLIPYDPSGLGGSLEEYKQHFDRALARNNIETFAVQVYETNEIVNKVTSFINDCDMIMVLPDLVLLNGFEQITKLSVQHGKATYVAQNLGALKEGATFAFGYHPYDVGVAGVQSARRILEDGIKPTNIPTNRLENTYHIGLNIDAARQQGVLNKMNESILFLMENGEVI